MPTRLIAYLVGALSLAGGLWWVAHTVSQWREAYRERPALIEARDQAIAARHRSETDVARQIAANQEIERAYNEGLRRSGAAARDLADRVRRYYTSLPRPVCPAPAAPREPHGAGPEPADGDRVDAATRAHLEACAGDAVRLTGLQAYVRGLPARCVPD